jgi:cytochrome c oxidase subunit 2
MPFSVKSLIFIVSSYSLAILANPAYCDAPEPWAIGLQDSASPIMEGITNFYHDLSFVMALVGTFVGYLIFRMLYLFKYSAENNQPARIIHHTNIEIVWTIMPAVVLMFIAVPSFALLYSMDEIVEPALTVKVIGHQWYWSYEYSDYINDESESLCFDSYMVPEEDLQIGQLRLLEVDNRVVVPVNTHVRFIVTAADVLHSFAIPSLGIKLDALPGRLNQTAVFIKRVGVFYGQCSEICGINHGFMPIVIEAVDLENYTDWISNKLEDI